VEHEPQKVCYDLRIQRQRVAHGQHAKHQIYQSKFVAGKFVLTRIDVAACK
jgi:hypothetical protein